MNIGDNSLFMVFQMISIGFKSGEYGGGNTRLMLSFFGFFFSYFGMMRSEIV